MNQIEWQLAHGADQNYRDQALILGDTAMFLFAALMLFSLPVIVTETMASTASPWRDFQDGIRYLMKNPSQVTLTTVFFNLLYSPYEVILPFVEKTIFTIPAYSALSMAEMRCPLAKKFRVNAL